MMARPAPRLTHRTVLAWAVLACITQTAAAQSPSRRTVKPITTPPSTATRTPAGSVAGGMGASTLGTPLERLSSSLNQIGGVGACGPAILRAAGFVFEDGEANFVVQPLGPEAGRWPVVIVVESHHPPAGQTRLTTITAAPTPGGCAGFYQQTIFWPQPCDVLKRTVFAPFTPRPPILGAVQASELNAGLQLYLLPAGGGCTSVKKELFR